MLKLTLKNKLFFIVLTFEILVAQQSHGFTIKADKIEYDKLANSCKAIGNVAVEMPEYDKHPKLFAPFAIIYFDSKEAAESISPQWDRISSIQASGGVKLINDEMKISGKSFQFQPNREYIDLIGAVFIHYKTHTLEGHHVIVDLKTQNAKIIGNTHSPKDHQGEIVAKISPIKPRKKSFNNSSERN